MRRDQRILSLFGLWVAALLLAGSLAFSAEEQEAFDPGPVLEQNRAWLHPDVEHLESVRFVHRVEPVAVRERFAWRRDGTSLVEVLERQWVAEAVGRNWVTTPDGALHFFAPGSEYAAKEPLPDRGLDRYLHNHLMGTRTNFVALDWGWKPDAFTVRNVRRDEDGQLVVQLVPNDTKYTINAGAMFHTGSSASVRDLRIGWGELTIDPRSRRILREVDYSLEGKQVSEIEFLEWQSVGAGREVPLRIHLRFPERKNFDVDYRFQWRDEGLWILAAGTSGSEGEDPQREEIRDLAINRPVPALDTALARVERSRQRLLVAETPPTTIRLADVHGFELGKKVVLAEATDEGPSPVQSLLFTFPDEEGASRWPRLAAEMLLAEPVPRAESGAELLLTLLDKSGRPTQVHRAPMAALLNAERGLAELAQSVREHNALWLSPGEGIPKLSYTFHTGSKSKEISVDESTKDDDLFCGVRLALCWRAVVARPERHHAPVQFTGTLGGREVIVAAVAESTRLSWGHGLPRVGYGGYRSMSPERRLLVVEKDSCRPLVSCYGDVEIHFLNYVEVEPGVSAPLRIVVVCEDYRDDFRFQILDGRVWLFDRSYRDDEPRASVENVLLGGAAARVTANAPEDVPPVDQLERLDWGRIDERRGAWPVGPPLVSEIIARTRPWEHPSYKPLLETEIGTGGGEAEPLVRLLIDRPTFYKEIAFWTLTWLSPDAPPRVLPGPKTLEVAAYPVKLDERVAVNVSSGKDEPYWGGIHTRINSYTVGREDGDLKASVEILSVDKSREIWAPVAAALVDEEGRLLAAGSDAVQFTIHKGIYSTEETIRLGRPHGAEPAQVLLGLQAMVTSMPMGSRWGTFFHRGPWFSYEQLLAAEDPRVWGHGVRSLHTKLRDEGLERDDLGDWWREHDGKRREMLEPHLDQLHRLLRTADDAEAQAPLARIAGHSGDGRFSDDLAKLLDHGQAEVQDAAAVGLGLLGDARGLERLRPILRRPLPEDKKDYQARGEVESWHIDAALALAVIGSDETLRSLGDVLLETVEQLREEPAERGPKLAGPVGMAEIVIQVLGGAKTPLMVDYFKQVLQSEVGRKLAYLMCPHLSRLDDNDAVREIFLEGIRRGEVSFIRSAPRDPAMVEAVAEVVARPDLSYGAFRYTVRYLGRSDAPEATEALRHAFDERLFYENEDMRLELIEALAERGDHRGLSEGFERLAGAVDASTLPEETKAREKEERDRRGRVRDLVRLITGEFPVSVVAEYLRPRKDADEATVRLAVESVLKKSHRIEVAVTTPPQRFPESVVQLSHVDDTAEGTQSYGGTGFGVRFTRPEEATHVVTVELYASRYGHAQPPAEDFHIYLLDEDQKVIQDVAYPYARVERGGETWYTFATPPTEVPREFFVGLWFNAHPTRGIFVGKDTGAKKSHSYTGTPEAGYQSVGDTYNWMVRVRVAPRDVAERVAAEMPSAPVEPAIPAPLLAPAEDQATGREVLETLAEVNRYWLSGPPPAVRTYSYEFQLDGSPPKKIEVDTKRSGGGAARQGISYYSPIHHLTRDPAQVRFRRVDMGEQRITLDYILAEPAPVAMGTGISGTWRGYFSKRVREGTLVVDAKRLVPLAHTARGLRETWSQYVDLDADHCAPLSIDVDTRFAWKFRVYEPGLWLFAFTGDGGSEGEKKLIASVDEVHVNGENATIKHAPEP